MTVRYQITRPAELQSLSAFRELVDQACAHISSIDDQTRYDLKLAVDEACTNIILYGYAGMDPGSIILMIEINKQAVNMSITDFGRPFEPIEVELPDLEALPDEGQEELGIFFIHQSTDQVNYESSSSGNTLQLIKYIKSSE